MKNTLYIRTCQILISSVLLFGLLSCEQGLEPNIYDKISGDNFPVTAEDARTIVSGIYFEFRGDGWLRYNVANDSRLVVGEFATDEFHCRWNGYQGSPFNFLWQPDEFPFSDMYYWTVPAITKATAAIAQLRGINTISEELKERYIAEIRVCRAYWMYDLYNLYGPVPVIMNEEDALFPLEYEPQPRPTNEWMVNTITTELEEAAKVLPKTYTSDDFGRFTSGAALMQLLKLQMHEKNWSAAEKTAREIIGLGVYELEADYRKIWDINNEQNAEIIFAIPCDPAVEFSGNMFRAHVLPSNWTSPSGLPVIGWDGYKVQWAFYDTFDEDDKRRNTLQRYYPGPNGSTIDQRSKANGGYGAIPVKYGEDPATTGQEQGNDYVIYRYADVLLLLAEALNEIHGPNQESINLINEVRSRAFDGAKPIGLSSFSNTEQLRQHILDERGWELCFEGCRREDLIRHGKFIEYANDPVKNGSKNPNGNAKPYHVLFPIPAKAIYENTLIKQNEGYQ